MEQRYASFREFYPFYLSEHSDRTNRRLHFIGSTLVLAELIAVAIGWLSIGWLFAALFTGYGFAWIGHFFFEHNKPATFKYPLKSFIGDWVMYGEILSGRIRF